MSNGETINVRIRPYRDRDASALWKVFFNAIHHTASRDYSDEQVAVWAPTDPDLERWAKRIADIDPFVAELDGIPVAYADLQPSGYIDHFFVSPDVGRRGVGSDLMRRILSRAAELKIGLLYSNVSITATPFFERWGFVVERERTVEINGVSFTNFRMSRGVGTS